MAKGIEVLVDRLTQKTRRVLASVVGFSALACASTHNDMGTQDLLMMTHKAAEPKGTLFVSEDRSYRYLDAQSGEKEIGGRLTDREYQSVVDEVHALASVYENRTLDTNRCEVDPDGYYLHSSHGSMCVVVSEIEDADVRHRLDTLVDLFNAKATAR